MRIKEKLTLGIVFLFVEFLIIALFGAYSIYIISQQSEKIMKDNNVSIQYAGNMLQTIDQINALQLAILFNPSNKSHGNELAGLYSQFEDHMRKEAGNVTEPGERELLQALTGEYQRYKVSVAEIDAAKDKSAFYFQNLLSKYHAIKTKIYQISDVNMQAILKKNENVNRYERRSYVILTIIASICFLLSIVFIFNFPGMISDPIRQLSENLKGVAEGKYDIRPNLKSSSEFKDMDDSVRAIADRLKRSEGARVEAALHTREDIAGTIEQTLERLRISHDQIRNLDIKRIIDDQSNLIEILQAELEQAKRQLTRT
jgi:two-component system, NtrC family, sensor histidine kinase KinB